MRAHDLAIPILPCRSIDATAKFYQQLGFAGGAHASNHTYAIFTRGDVEIHFFEHSQLVPADSFAGCYIRVNDVEPLYHAWRIADLPPAGIPRMERLEDKPWGLREFAIVDPDGNLLRVGQLIDARLTSPDPSARVFYHGTRASLQPGDLIQGGFLSNYTERRSPWVYFSETLNAAVWGAELAKGEGLECIYVVEPTGPFEDDPNLTNTRFPGNPTKSYRSRHPVRVVRRQLDWQAHSPDEIQKMKDGIAGLEPIDD